MNILQAILLGIIQGITEWLPISSSGHLVIAQVYLDIEEPIFFNAMVHLGTLVVVVWVFRTEIRDVILAFLESMKDMKNGVSFQDSLKEPEHRLAFLIIVGTLPIAIIGILFRSQIESMYAEPLIAGIALVFTGIYLLVTKWARHPVPRTVRVMTFREAILIGLVQAIAIIPGVSRSGSTIATGLLMGLNREVVARYSFLLFIPAILGATMVQMWDVIIDGSEIEWIPTIVGTVTAMVVGYFSIKLLLRVIRQSKLYLFSPYCIIVGILVVAAELFL